MWKTTRGVLFAAGFILLASGVGRVLTAEESGGEGPICTTHPTAGPCRLPSLEGCECGSG